jgi:hypothetical protein
MAARAATGGALALVGGVAGQFGVDLCVVGAAELGEAGERGPAQFVASLLGRCDAEGVGAFSGVVMSGGAE